jgi:hypothetical protein
MPEPQPFDLNKYKQQADELIAKSKQSLQTPPPVANDVNDQVTGDMLRGPNPGNNFQNKGVNNVDYIYAWMEKAKNLPSTQGALNPGRMATPYTFGTEYDQTNYLRYYNTSKYQKLGFNPYRDNEEIYNQNMTRWDEVKRSMPQFLKLAWTGVKSGFRSWGDVFSGEFTSSDLKSAREMQEAMAVGSSGKGGVMGFLMNTQLNAGYTLGIAAELGLEELALMGATAATGGAAGAETGPLMATRAGMAGKRVLEGFEAIKNIRSQFKALEGVSQARAFWNGIKGVGKSALNIANPFERSVQALQKINRVDHANGLAKISFTAGQFIRDVRDINLALSESKLEAGMVQLDETRDLIQKFRDDHGRDPIGDELSKIHEHAKRAAAKTLYWNLPVIMGTNKMVYETLFKGFKGVPHNMATLTDELGNRVIFNAKGFGDPNTVFKVFEDGIKSRMKQLRYFNFKRAGLGFLKTNLGEGIQESMQDVVSGASKKYYRDLYNNNNAKGAHESFMGRMAEGIGEQFSGQGLETFMGGFLMGSMVGPIQGVPFWAMRKVQQFRSKNDPQYADYKAKKTEQIQKQADLLNKMYSNPREYFNSRVNAMEMQAQFANQQQEAAESGDKKQHYDAKDEVLFESVHTALKTNTMDVFVKRLEGMKEMTADELKEGFGLTDNPHLKIEEAVTRAKHIKRVYDKIEDMYGVSPFNPDNHKKGTQGWNASILGREAWNQAKKMLVYSQFNYDRSLERLESIYNDVSSHPDVSGAGSNDFTVLFNLESMTMEIETLKREISTLNNAVSSSDKKMAVSKQEKLNLLKEFRNKMFFDPGKLYKEAAERAAGPITTGTRVQVRLGNGSYSTVRTIENDTYTLDDGRIVRQSNVEKLSAAEHFEDVLSERYEEARPIYSQYVKSLAKSKGKRPVFNDQIDTSFDNIRDYYRLNEDARNLAKHINVLSNPEGFLTIAQRFAETHKELWDERTMSTRKRMKNIVDKFELNTGLQVLYQHGAFVDPDQLEAFITAAETKQPFPEVTKFVTTTDLSPIAEESEKYKEIKELWEAQKDLIAEDFFEEYDKQQAAQQEAEKKEEPQEQTEVQEKQPEVQPAGEVKPEDVTQDTSWAQLPEGLQAMLIPEFDKYVERSRTQYPEDWVNVDMVAIRDQWYNTHLQAKKILNKWRELNKLGIPTKGPAIPETILKSNVDISTKSLPELEALLRQYKQAQEINPSEDRGIDIKILSDYMAFKSSLAGAKTKLQEVVDTIRNITNSAVIQKFPGYYLINNEIYNRVTRVITPIELKMTGKDDFSYKNLSTFKTLYQSLMNQGKTVEDYIEHMRTVNLIKEDFNDRKLEELRASLEEDNTVETLIATINELAYDGSRTAGTTVDGIVRDFFMKGTANLSRPDGISQEAFTNLLGELRKLKAEFDAKGLQPITDNIVIFDPVNKVAGEIDMLLADKDGNVYIFDVKTSQAKNWKDYKAQSTLSSSQLKHQLQLSTYSNILANGYGLNTQGLGVIPFTITYDLDGHVKSIKSADEALKGTDSMVFPLQYNSAIEKAVPKGEAVSELDQQKEKLEKLKDADYAEALKWWNGLIPRMATSPDFYQDKRYKLLRELEDQGVLVSETITDPDYGSYRRFSVKGAVTASVNAEATRNEELDNFVEGSAAPSADQTTNVKAPEGALIQYVQMENDMIGRVWGVPVVIPGYEELEVFAYKHVGEKMPYHLVYRPSGITIFPNVDIDLTPEEVAQKAAERFNQSQNVIQRIKAKDSFIAQIVSGRIASDSSEEVQETEVIIKPVRGMVNLQAVQEKLNKIKSLKELVKFENQMLVKIAGGKMAVATDVFQTLVAQKKAELVIPTVDNVRKGSVIIQKGVGTITERLFTVEKKTKKEIVIRMINTSENKSIKPEELQNYQHYDESTPIAEVPQPTTEENKIAKENQEGYSDFAKDNQKVEQLLNEAKSKPQAEVRNSFLKNIGCK